MGLESGDYIDDLVSTNPVGASDNVSQGDDHLRLIKKVLLQTFPNLTGAMTRTQAQLNDVVLKGTNQTITATHDFTGDPTIDSSQIGFKGAPQNIQNGDYTLVIGDAGKQIYKASGGAGETITIPANASVAFVVGTIIEIVNDGGDDLSVAITSDTLEKYNNSTGTQTLGDNNKAIIEKVTSTLWKYSSTD